MRWDLGPLYADFDDPRHARDHEACLALLAGLEARRPPSDEASLEELLRGLVALRRLRDRLFRFADLRASLDGADEEAARERARCEGLEARETALHLRLEQTLPHLGRPWEGEKAPPLIRRHAFFLGRLAVSSTRRMGAEAEELALALGRSGSSAWEELWRRSTSTWQAEGPRGPVGLGALRGMARSFEEDETPPAWWREAMDRAHGVLAPVAAACLNGIKGEVVTVTRRRGWPSPLAATLFEQKIDERSLASLWRAVEASRPLFLRFEKLRRSAPALAPEFLALEPDRAVEETALSFDAFSPAMGALARRAWKEGWIDWPPRPGKAGGAFCRPVYPIGESRILLNGRSDLVSMATVAHELGHAFHNAQLLDESPLAVKYPMPMAESASLFAETLALHGWMERDDDPARRRALLDLALSSSRTSLLGIRARFLFEEELFRRREDGPLGADELDALEDETTERAMGDLAPRRRSEARSWPFLSQLYRARSNFYNFPYAFGRLLAFTLVARLRREGEGLATAWLACLSPSGRSTVEDALGPLGGDCRDEAFWEEGLDEIGRWVDRYEELLPSTT